MSALPLSPRSGSAIAMPTRTYSLNPYHLNAYHLNPYSLNP